jgi:hypothetical protein
LLKKVAAGTTKQLDFDPPPGHCFLHLYKHVLCHIYVKHPLSGAITLFMCGLRLPASKWGSNNEGYLRYSPIVARNNRRIRDSADLSAMLWPLSQHDATNISCDPWAWWHWQRVASVAQQQEAMRITTGKG